MIENKSVVGIITARGGSKGLPGKNIKMLCGKPLIAWTIESALLSTYLDVVVVTTDSPEIAEIARSVGAEVPFLRPIELATDEATSYDAIQHTLDYYKSLGRVFDYTVLLEPTSPLREKDDIDRVISGLHGNRDCFDSAITLGEVRDHPSVIMKVADNLVIPFAPNMPIIYRRQDAEALWTPYVVAFAAKTSSLRSERTFYLKRCMGIFLKKYQKYEIDDIYDFLCVEAIMNHQLSLGIEGN